MIQFASALAQLGGGVAAVTQPAPPPPPLLIALPSDGLEKARPKISLSSILLPPGSRLEALMRSAAFTATEHKYDI